MSSVGGRNIDPGFPATFLFSDENHIHIAHWLDLGGLAACTHRAAISSPPLACRKSACAQNHTTGPIVISRSSPAAVRDAPNSLAGR